ncbi:MAG: M14 family metallocarboxypeptidase [Verrucomicrobiae bacterium]|nr:M14 family metallocarboxypeptidase [Verrucomicrobiae bacterium]
MQRLGRNHRRYLGDTLDVPRILAELRTEAVRNGWTLGSLTTDSGTELPVLTRAPRHAGLCAPRLYFSAGIHGDEPAGPLAVLELLRQAIFPEDAWGWCCPCLNPTGLALNTRESAAGIDLNRDYREAHAPEVRAHIEWLRRQPLFDLALCLHEDWEAAGFYVYEVNSANQPSLAPAMVEAVRPVCPIDLSPVIDGRDAHQGIIRPTLDPAMRPEWPEAFYLLQNKTRLSYTLEAPSDYPLDTRVAALVAGVRAAFDTFTRTPPPRDDTSPPPP